MNKEIEDAIAEHERRLDELFFQLGDVLDVKASIILVVITFLGAISGQVLSLKDLPLAITIMQIIAVLSLAVAVFSTVRSLWPRTFEAPPDSADWIEYLQKLEQHYAGKDGAAELVLKDFQQDMAATRQERIKKNRALTRNKSGLNEWAFRGTVVAATAEAICLIWLAFWHL